MNPISNTAFYCCGVRMDDAKRNQPVCNDVYADRFMDERGMKIYEPFRSEKMPNISNITRCRIIDDYVSIELTDNNSVNIITIGAGFDTRPYRITGGNWIEVDEPQIISYKNKKLPIEECKNPLRRISIDFASETLAGKLEDVDKSLHTVIVIEGVFMYLDSGSIENTLREIQQMLPEHVLFCDLMTKNFFNKFAKSVHSKLVATGGRFTDRIDNPEKIFILNKYKLIERVPMFNRAGELGILWDEVKIPALAARLMLNLFMKDLSGYSVHHFRYS
ncbi:MAG: class I SAM-dependent methyltransferase [Gammaproteobacteria bacterium]|nr:class I SAM-dependent methyltransferase [Gammaproteobacteria bacterium]